MNLVDEVRKACLNPEFRSRFKANPRICLKELGYILNDDIEISVLEDKPKIMHLILPIDGWLNLPEARDLDKISGVGSGVCNNSGSSHTCCYVTDI
jgi:hypothetical protein